MTGGVSLFRCDSRAYVGVFLNTDDSTFRRSPALTPED